MGSFYLQYGHRQRMKGCEYHRVIEKESQRPPLLGSISWISSRFSSVLIFSFELKYFLMISFSRFTSFSSISFESSAVGVILVKVRSRLLRCIDSRLRYSFCRLSSFCLSEDSCFGSLLVRPISSLPQEPLASLSRDTTVKSQQFTFLRGVLRWQGEGVSPCSCLLSGSMVRKRLALWRWESRSPSPFLALANCSMRSRIDSFK